MQLRNETSSANALDLFQGLKRLAGKSLSEILPSIRRSLQKRSTRRRFIRKAWSPEGAVPFYAAYYPDRLKALPDLTELYRRWVRGNMENNNGDAPRFMGLVLNLEQLQKEGIPGDFAELGVWKGNSAAILAHYAAQSQRRLFLFDTFTGFDTRDCVGIDDAVDGDQRHFADTSLSYVQETIGPTEAVTFLRGFFPETVTAEAAERVFALAHIDCDLYKPTKAALEFFYPRMPKGGFLILHDYSSVHWYGPAQAVDEFCAAHNEFVSIWPDKSGTAVIRKSH